MPVLPSAAPLQLSCYISKTKSQLALRLSYTPYVKYCSTILLSSTSCYLVIMCVQYPEVLPVLPALRSILEPAGWCHPHSWLPRDHTNCLYLPFKLPLRSDLVISCTFVCLIIPALRFQDFMECIWCSVPSPYIHLSWHLSARRLSTVFKAIKHLCYVVSFWWSYRVLLRYTGLHLAHYRSELKSL